MAEPKKTEGEEGAPETGGAKKQRSKQSAAGDNEQLLLTLSPPEGEIVKAEWIDASGQRRELSEEEISALAGEGEEDEDERLLRMLLGRRRRRRRLTIARMLGECA